MLTAYSEAAQALGQKVTLWAAQGTNVPAVPLTASWPLARADTMLAIAYSYLVLVGVGAYVMSRSGMEPIKLPRLQRVYNFVQVALCSYMCVEAARIAYRSGYTLWPCVPFNAMSPPIGSVLWLFYCSKVLDFMDTAFIVLGKKWAQLSFLHVYHHWSIYQIYWLNLWVGYDGDIYLTIVLNAFIHSVMYSYYLCSEQKGNFLGALAKTVKPFITSLQLIQFCCMIAQATALLAGGCTSFPPNTTRLYFCYILTMIALFGRFFVKSYLGKPAAPRGERKAAQREADDDKQEVLIDGVLYNISGFRHPGGSIVHFYRGKGDATETFEQFHYRSKRAQRLLKSLPSRPCPEELSRTRAHANTALVADFRKLFRELQDEGYLEPHMGEVAYRLAEVLAMFVGGFCLLLGCSGLPARAAGVLVLGLAQGRCGWLMHEGGHVSLTGSWKWDHRLQVLIYGVGCGMSAGWWRTQHNKHHATPQKLQHDADLDTLPLVAFNQAVVAKVRNPVLKAWLKVQGICFIPLTCLIVTLGWQAFLHPRFMWRTGKYDEAAAFGFRYALLFGWLLGGHTWVQAISVYLLMMQVSGSYIFTNFSMSHTHLDVTQPDEILSWSEYAAKHTTNISNHWFVNWWMAYLNFQIEHHLFPSMPQFRHPLIAPRVKALFEKHGLKYDVRGYFSCLGDTLRNLSEVGNGAGQGPDVKKVN